MFDKPKIFIFGSCVSRDMFRLCDDNQEQFSLVDYIARQSIISTMSEELDIGPDDISLDSPFQKRLVLCDLQKSLLSNLENHAKTAWLLIDLVDERFPVLEKDGNYYTKSDEFSKTSIQEDFGPFEIVDIEERKRLFSKFVPRFAGGGIEGYLEKSNLILLKTKWVDDYIGLDGSLHSFSESQKEIFLKFNNDIDYYQNEFLKHCRKKVHIIEVSNPIGYEGHIWGLSGIHYTDEYYREAYRQLLDIVCIS